MFKLANQEDMKKEMGNSFLTEAFCGIATISGLEKVTGSNGSGSEGLKIKIETEKGMGQFQIWYRKKDGSENEYGIKQLTAIMGITKLNPAKFEVETEVNGFGKEIHNIKMQKEVECGLYLTTKIEEYDGKEITKLEFRGAFYPQNKKTLAEQLNNSEARMYKKWMLEVEKANVEAGTYKETAKTENNAELDSEFPF